VADLELSSYGDFLLGDWVVQPRLNRITRGDRVERLEPRCVDLLVFLARHPGEVQSRDRLIDEVWRVEAVAENTLTHAIAELRRALGDDARSPRYIETIHRRGYRLLVAPGRISDEHSSASRTLSHYLLLEHLGGGGMGVVYRATDTKLQREVALKFLPKALSSDAEARERFMREARAASALDHPHICTIHEIDETPDGQLFIVMAFYDGETVKKKIERGPLPPEDTVRIGGQVAEGLQRAHEAGIVHRDIKPANVMVTSDGVAKIVDFGLAKVRRQFRESETESPTGSLDTSPGTVIGTVAYMAPEQVRGEPADHRSDIFALGCMLYEMLTGERAFKRDTTAEVMTAILREEPRSFSDFDVSVPSELVELVRRCLEKDPEDRIQSASDVALALGSARRIAESPTTKGESVRARPWALPLLAVAGILIVALAMLFGPEILERLGRHPEQAPIRSIAILPLKNLTGDPEQEYFVDGLHEELITTFAQISGFDKVIARTSVMGFRDSNAPAKEIGRQLDVAALIEGSVRRSGDTVRTTIQLIDTRTGENLWAKSFDRELQDILALHSEVARAVADAVNLALSSGEEARFARSVPVDHEAYEAYLMGNHLKDFVESDLEKAIGFYRLAIEKDPEFARGYSGLASGYLYLGLRFRPADEVVPLALEAAQRAIDLDDSDGEAHAVLGTLTFWWEWDWSKADAAFRRALDLQPNSALVNSLYSQFLAGMLRFDDAVAIQRRALELSPLSRRTQRDLGWVYWATRRYDEAVTLLSDFVVRYPDAIHGRMILSWSYSLMGETADAVTVAEEARDRHPAPDDDPFLLMTLAWAYGCDGDTEAAEAVLRRLHELRRTKYIPPSYLSFAHYGIGDEDGGYEWFRKTLEERHGHAAYVRMFAAMIPDMGADPRIHELIEDMHFPENW
jgi:serine/threonine protein kinase/TolB-like protein/Tfp pilus assembly protein PilF